MRLLFVMTFLTIGLAGCMSNQDLGSPGGCVQAGSTVDAPVMCPSG